MSACIKESSEECAFLEKLNGCALCDKTLANFNDLSAHMSAQIVATSNRPATQHTPGSIEAKCMSAYFEKSSISFNYGSSHMSNQVVEQSNRLVA